MKWRAGGGDGGGGGEATLPPLSRRGSAALPRLSQGPGLAGRGSKVTLLLLG